jgi:hypothetical protein
MASHSRHASSVSSRTPVSSLEERPEAPTLRLIGHQQVLRVDTSLRDELGNGWKTRARTVESLNHWPRSWSLRAKLGRMQNPVTASAPRRGKAAAVCTLQQGSRLLPAQTRTRAASDTREYVRHGSDAVTQSEDRHDAFLQLHNSKSGSCIRIPIYETIGSGSKESPGLIRETRERGKTLLLPELDSRGDAKTHSLGASERGERVAVVHRISVARDCSPRVIHHQ